MLAGPEGKSGVGGAGAALELSTLWEGKSRLSFLKAFSLSAGRFWTS